MPGTGKSFVAEYVVSETLLRGVRVIYWDFEDKKQSIRRRMDSIGIDLREYEDDDLFHYVHFSKGEMADSALAMSQAVHWLATGKEGKGLIILDAAETSGAFADAGSREISEWLDQVRRAVSGYGVVDDSH